MAPAPRELSLTTCHAIVVVLDRDEREPRLLPRLPTCLRGPSDEASLPSRTAETMAWRSWGSLGDHILSMDNHWMVSLSLGRLSHDWLPSLLPRVPCARPHLLTDL